jgi:hypothetical protein
MFFTTRLIIYHVNLILNDITTKEKENNVYYNGIPYTRKHFQNVKNILFPVIKKYSILDILRGDFKEICDKKDVNDSKIKTKILLNDDYINTETIANFKINKLMISLNEYKQEKNDETNFGLNKTKENSQNKLISEGIIPNILNKQDNNYINSINVAETNDNIKDNSYNKEKDIIKDYPDDTIP